MRIRWFRDQRGTGHVLVPVLALAATDGIERILIEGLTDYLGAAASGQLG